MFKIAKYYILINLYQKARRNIFAIIITTFLLVISTYVFSDLIDVVDGNNRYGLIVAKWILIVLFLTIIAFNIIKLFKAIQRPFKKEHKYTILDTKKERILDKEHLVSRSEIILNKYKSSK